MTPPVLPFGSLGALRGSSTAGMGHTARQRIQMTTELPDEEVEPVGEPTLGPAICCHLKVISSTLADVAAASGIKAQWSLKVPRGTRIPPGSQWEVTTDCDEVYPVEVTGDLVRVGRVMRLVAAVDVPLDG